MSDRESRLAVITGASSGIGLAAARALAGRGWRVIGIGRDPERTRAAEAALGAAAPNGEARMLVADLSLLRDVDRVAGEIAGLTDKVHCLANNAGSMTQALVMTDEGLEANFAANHVGPFRLTQRLLPLLKRAASDGSAGPARIVMTSSDGSEMIPGLDCDDLQNLARWSPGAAYCTGKLANVLFARALAERLAGEGVVAHAFHPGSVASNFIAHVAPETRAYMESLDLITPEEGADTLVWLATADEAAQSSGGYWYRRAPRAPNPFVEQEGIAGRFWQASEDLVRRAIG